MPFFDNVFCSGRKRGRKKGRKEGREEGRADRREGRREEEREKQKKSYYPMFLLLYLPRIEQNYSTQFCLIIVFLDCFLI